MNNDALPDVALDQPAEYSLPLQWVGMEQIAVPMMLPAPNGQLKPVSAFANVFVNLKAGDHKGIHMSRLHGIVNRLADEPCSKETLDSLLHEIVDSHQDISSSGKLQLSFDYLVKKSALLSEEYGYQTYSVRLDAENLDGKRQYSLSVTIPYSSTCPCSASLSAHLYGQAIDQQFSDEKIDKQALLDWVQSAQGIVATPHSQRSYAEVRLTFGDHAWLCPSQLIKELETLIATPVQTAVKRRDEQEFARLNANNLMFCEDAGRRIKAYLESLTSVSDYWFKLEHQESLHPHNAVVIDQKR